MKPIQLGGASLALAIGVAAFPATTAALATDTSVAAAGSTLVAAPARSEAPQTVPDWNIADNVLTIGPGTFTFANNELAPWNRVSSNYEKVVFTEPSRTAFVGSTAQMFAWSQVRTFEGIKDIDVSRVTSMSSMFSSVHNLESLDLSGWDVSNVTDMSSMFNEASSLTSLDISGWETDSLQLATSMFENARALTVVDVANWNTSKLWLATGMFASTSSLGTLDVSKWDTQSLSGAMNMFQDASTLSTLDVSNWDTTQLQNASRMFEGMSSLEAIDVSQWDTNNLWSAEEMFANMTSLTALDLSGWTGMRDTTNQKGVEQFDMFAGTTLRSLTIPKKFRLSAESALNETANDSDFTGKWDLAGDWEGTAAELIARTNTGERDETPDTYLWQRNATLTLTPNGATGEPITVRSTANKKFTLSESTFELLNAKFAGWNELADGKGKSYAPGDTFVFPAGASTLYAQWNTETTPPVKPVKPVDPTLPVKPVDPVTPIVPVKPVLPTTVAPVAKLANTGSSPLLTGVAAAGLLAAGGAAALLLHRRARNR